MADRQSAGSDPANAKRTHGEIYALLERVLDRLGEENAEGTGGTGLIGRVMRVEAKVHAYDELKQRAYGAIGALAVSIGVVWWLVKAKVAALFGVSSS